MEQKELNNLKRICMQKLVVEKTYHDNRKNQLEYEINITPQKVLDLILYIEKLTDTPSMLDK